jgi:pimeloyl-ACP methyl ester carboxylesterase
MANFLFIHGSWHGAWCWHKVLPLFKTQGHNPVAIDLPGRGRHPAATYSVSLNTMVSAAERALPIGQKTTIVVHSRYGIVASALAERVPERIDRTIYLASFMIPNGKRVLDYLPDKGSLLTGRVDINRLGLWDRLQPEIYREALYADCSQSDVELARALLVREPLRPAVSKLKTTQDRYESVPRAYIRLLQDKAVSLEMQDRLLNETMVERVESISASHSAYFSQPEKLATTILKLASK